MHHIFVLHWFSNAYDLLSTYKNVILNLQISRSYVKFVCDVCIVITTSDMDHTVYLQMTPCLPLLPSSRASPPFGWYSFYRPTEGRRLSRLGWLVTSRNKVPPQRVKPGHGHPSQY